MNKSRFETKHGIFNVIDNDQYFIEMFMSDKYWSEESLLRNLQLINKNKNVIEFGSHIGTDTIPYAKCLTPGNVVYSFEPQTMLYNVLVQNIIENGLVDKIVARNLALFYFDGMAAMSGKFLSGKTVGQVVANASKPSNYAGLCLGQDGESVQCTQLDSLNLTNIGFIHSDAQGAEPFIFYGARQLIAKERPIIYFEDISKVKGRRSIRFGNLTNQIIDTYNPPDEIKNFDIVKYCTELGYTIEGPYDLYNYYLMPNNSN